MAAKGCLNMEDIIDISGMLYDLQKEHFLENVLFSIQWWFLLLLTILLWVIWFRLVDKRRMGIILLVGLITALLATLMDDVGLTLTLWHYPNPLTPFISRLNSVDLAIVPVGYMLLYQYAKRWKPYVIALFLMTLFAILVAEPLFGKWGLYLKIKWEYWYSGPIYFAMGIFVKWVVDKVDKVSHSHWQEK